jgi:hypothetical protein
MVRTTLALVVAGLVVAAPAFAGDTVKHSGTIAAVDPVKHELTLVEMGRWSGPKTTPTRRSIELAPSTRVELVARSKASKGWPGQFTETALPASDLYPGDYVTVTVERAGKRLKAVSIEVVRPGGAG